MSAGDRLSAYQPKPDALTEPFWRGTANGELRLARCPRCRAWEHPPLETCRRCEALLADEAAPLNGVVYSATTMRHRAIALYEPPYTVAVVEVGGTGGPRVVMRAADDCVLEPGDEIMVTFAALPGGDFQVPIATPTAVRSA